MNAARLSNATWIFPESDSYVLNWTIEETGRVVSILTGNRGSAHPGCDDAADRPGTTIAVGSRAIESLAERNTGLDDAVSAILREAGTLEEESYIVRSLSSTTVAGDNRSPDIIAITGGSEQALCWGCFHFLESLGCEFRISSDVIPRRTDPVIPPIDDRCSPAHRVRGVWFSYCFPTNSIMSLEDYHLLFGQMVKLRLNRFNTYHFENEPFVDFSFRGERKVVGDISHPTSGYISYGRHFSGSYLVSDIAIGAELFERERVAPMEFQDVRSSDEALDTGVAFMRSIHRLARDFGIEPWLSVIPSFVPMNMTKYTRRMPRPHMHWSALVSFTDPVLDDINRNRIASIVRDYPDLGGLALGIPEGYYEDPYPESVAIIERERPRYRSALDVHKSLWGKYWNDNQELLEAHIDRDIGFVEILKRSIDIAREIAPDLKLGVMTVCKAYLFELLHEDLPKDIAFTDIESRSLWTVDGAPLHLFDGLEGRECTVIPRAVDDGSNAGLQHNLELYSLDRFLQSPVEHGTSGLVIQTTHIRGNEHNVGFIAAGMWNPDLTPEAYYRRYSAKIAGSSGGPLLERAFAVLEKNEQELGGRGQGNMPWNKVPAHIEVLRKFRDFNQPFCGVPYDEGFVRMCGTKSEYFGKAIGRLEEAGSYFSQALESAMKDMDNPGMIGTYKREITYLIEKNSGYRHHLSCLIELGRFYKLLYESFDRYARERSHSRTRIDTAALTALVESANLHAEQSARHFARAVDHPTDLGVLWSINTSTVIGTRILTIYMANLRCFFEGKEYWRPIPWERLFDECPYPAYTLDEMTLTADDQNAEYEPG